LAEKLTVGLLLAAGLRVATFYDLPGIVSSLDELINEIRVKKGKRTRATV